MLYSQFRFVPLSLLNKTFKFPSEVLGTGEIERCLLTITIFTNDSDLHGGTEIRIGFFMYKMHYLFLPL